MADYRSKDYSESQPAFGTPEWNECLRAHLLSALGSYGQLSAITINPFDVREHPLAHSSDKTRYYERLAADNQPFLPVVVAPRPEGGYVLLDGIHRLAVSQMLNKPLKALVASNQSLQKMAIKDIRLGTKLRPGDPRENPMGFHRYDYTHVLPSAHQAAGYKLNVYHDPEPGTDNRFVKAVLTHPKGMTSKFYPGHVGHLSGEITPAGELHLDVAEIDKAHRGGKGLPLYEALMAHASKALGAHTVVGGEHSTMASGVHKKLSAKHGMDYSPVPRPEAAHTTTGEFDNKFGSYKYTIKSEKLDKGISSFVTAMMLAGHPGDYSSSQAPKTEQVNPSNTWTAEGLHEDLHPIAHLESSWGKNVAHKPGRNEMDTAHGAVGFKPQTAFETYAKSKLAQKKYPDAANPSSFLEKFKQDPEFYNAMASLHFDRLKKLHGSTDKAVYAWRHGSGAASKATPEAIESEPYVQKYKALRGVKKLGKSQRDKETTKVVSVAAYKDGLLLFGLRGDKRKWCLPGGHMEPGEERLEAAQRELLEETSLMGSNWEYLGSENIPTKGVIVYCYRCEVDGDPSSDKDPDSEFIQFQWADPDYIPEEIKENLYNNPDANLDLQCINYSVEISKSEELEKGAMSRLFPYNPAIDSIAGKRSFNESKGRAHLADWQMWADPKDRQKIPQMKGNVMERGLHRLHGSTQVRRSPTGEREFLLHRSMNAEEFNKFHNQGVFSPDKNTSWAPSDNYGATYAAHTVSAWVPESSILSIPKQYGTLKYREPGRGIFDKLSNKYIQGGRNEMAPEHEVVLKPGSFQVHSTKTRKVEKTEELSKAARKPKFGPEQKNLVVTHNISEAGLEHAHKLGGLASPSLAVTHKDHPLKSFGNVTLVAPHHLADPSVHPVYDADIYSARHPRSEFKVNRKKLNALSSELDPHFKAIGSDYGSVMDSEFQRHGPKLAQESYNVARGLKHAWLKEKGVEIPDFKQEDNKIDRFKAADWIDAKTKELGEGDFHDWAEKKLEPLNEGQYIPKFSQSTGAKRQVPYTLDNILKEMKGNPRQGENFNYGLGSIRAGGAKKFKDIEQMRQHQGNIVSPEAFKKIKEDMGKRWDALNEELKQYHGTKLSSPSGLGEAISNSYRRGKFLGNELSRAGFENVPPEMQSKVHEFAKDLVQMPTEYFEAKPQRVVGLNEFKGAAVPKDAHPRTIERLKSHGIQHIEQYDPETEGDRARAVNAIAQAQNLHLSEDGLPGSVLFKEEDYRGVHKAPMNNGYHAPLHALNQIYPEDVYSPQAAQFYGHGEPKLDRETVKILHAAKGNPEHPVTMYRAIPKDVKATAIKPGDWVTPNANYAKLHGESALGGNYQIIKQVVPAKHLFTDANSIHEFGYDPGVPTHKTEEETSNFPKKCHNCGAVHTSEAWGSLPHVGNQNTEDETHNYTLEMRNCNCGSTLGIETATPKVEKSEDLEKNRPGPKFPKLGIAEDRRETEQVTTPRQLKIKQLAQANAAAKESDEKFDKIYGSGMAAYGNPTEMKARARERIKQDYTAPETHILGAAPSSGKTKASYSLGAPLLPSGPQYSGKTPNAIQIHENNHMIFNRVENQHGAQARRNLAQNLWHHAEQVAGPEAANLVNKYLYARYPMKYRGDVDHEERIGTVLNLLNDPGERNLVAMDPKYAHIIGTKLPNGRVVNDRGPLLNAAKKMHQAILESGRLADTDWTAPHQEFKGFYPEMMEDYKKGVYKNEALLKDPTPGKRILALKNKKIDKEKLWDALHDEHPEVRAFAAKHPGMTYEMLFQALSHPDIDTRKQALQNPNITEDHRNFASGDPELTESEELSKNIGYVQFPKLGQGVQTTPNILSPEKAANQQKLVGGARPHGEWGTMYYNAAKNPDKALPGKQRKMSGYIMASKNPKAMAAQEAHEAQHSVFAGLAQKHGVRTQQAAIAHTLSALSGKEKALLHAINPELATRAPGRRDEETIAYMQNFLQDPQRRKDVLDAFRIKGKRLSDEGKRKIHTTMKDMWKRMRARAAEFGPEHVEAHKASVQKSEKEAVQSFLKSVNDYRSLRDIVEDMAGHSLLNKRIQKAAEFLSGNQVDSSVYRSHFYETEDEMASALVAVGMEPTEENLKALKAVVNFETTQKSEIEKPKQIKALEPQGEKVTQAIQAGLDVGAAEVPDFKGKHTNGMWVIESPKDDKSYLVKPGEGKLSPAKGISEQVASPSQRETAYYEIAKALGLEKFFVPTCLVEMDGCQAAAIEMLPTTWQPLEATKFEDKSLPTHILEKYRVSGDLFIWSVLDFILGNADRHGSNLLVGPGEDNYPVVMIDHGTTFAGQDFAPGQDKNTFIPYYLRAWNQKSFKKTKDLEERASLMPVSTDEGRVSVLDFIERLNPAELEGIMAGYGIDAEPVKQRIEKIKQLSRSPLPIDQALNLVWLGVTVPVLAD